MNFMVIEDDKVLLETKSFKEAFDLKEATYAKKSF